MKVKSGTLYFYREFLQEADIISHQLKNLHVTSIDTPSSNKTNLGVEQKFFIAKLGQGKSYRKMFFPTFICMEAAISYILSA